MLGIELYRPAWELPGDVCAAVTYRDGGVSEGSYANFNLSRHVGDEQVAVSENRMRLQGALAGSPELAWMKQVHAAEVADATHVHASRGAYECDAQWTSRRNLACAVTTADCLPVLFAASDGSMVAAAHAGWRGLAAGVIASAAAPFAATGFSAFIGPCISAANYVVRDDVRGQLLAAGAPAAAFGAAGADGYSADLVLIATTQLKELGATTVGCAGLCTYADRARFFSARRDGARSGRFASVIWIGDRGEGRVLH